MKPRWVEIGVDWLKCLRHGHQFSVGAVCTACVEEERGDEADESGFVSPMPGMVSLTGAR